MMPNRVPTYLPNRLLDRMRHKCDRASEFMSYRALVCEGSLAEPVLNALLGAYGASLRLCALVMTVWAMLMVEIVNPTVQDMQEKRLACEKSQSCDNCFLYGPFITLGGNHCISNGNTVGLNISHMNHRAGNRNDVCAILRPILQASLSGYVWWNIGVVPHRNH